MTDSSSTQRQKPILIDLFCCAGGAAVGYARAGFEVVGVDIAFQPNFPFPFHKGDAISVMRRLRGGESVVFTMGDTARALTLGEVAAFAASPPCQAFTSAQRIRKNDHPDLVAATREAFTQARKPWVIENVVGAPLRPDALLCGAMFGLRTYRHRVFESSVPIEPPHHPAHVARTTKMGRPIAEGEFMHIVGNFSGASMARQIMGMPWATRDELREAIPPAYTEHIGKQLIEHINQESFNQKGECS